MKAVSNLSSYRWVTWQEATASLSCLSTWATWTALWSPSSTVERVSSARVLWSWSWSSTSWRSFLRSTDLQTLPIKQFFNFKNGFTTSHSLARRHLPSTIRTSEEPENCAVPGEVAFFISNLCIHPSPCCCRGLLGSEEAQRRSPLSLQPAGGATATHLQRSARVCPDTHTRLPLALQMS